MRKRDKGPIAHVLLTNHIIDFLGSSPNQQLRIGDVFEKVSEKYPGRYTHGQVKVCLSWVEENNTEVITGLIPKPINQRWYCYVPSSLSTSSTESD